MEKLSNKIPLSLFFLQQYSQMSEQSEYVTAVFVVFENDDNDNDVCAFVTIKRYARDCLFLCTMEGEWRECIR